MRMRFIFIGLLVMLFVFPSTFAGKSYFLNFSEEPIQAATLAAGDRVSFELNGGIHHIIVDEIGTRKGVRIGFVPAGQNMVNLAPINTDFSAYIDVEKDNIDDLKVSVFNQDPNKTVLKFEVLNPEDRSVSLPETVQPSAFSRVYKGITSFILAYKFIVGLFVALFLIIIWKRRLIRRKILRIKRSF